MCDPKATIQPRRATDGLTDGVIEIRLVDSFLRCEILELWHIDGQTRVLAQSTFFLFHPFHSNMGRGWMTHAAVWHGVMLRRT